MNEKKLMLVISGIISGCIQISLVIALLIFPSVISNSTTLNSFTQNGLRQEHSVVNEISKSGNNGFFKNLQPSKSGASNVIVIYNGVTIDEGIKSNEEIDNKARQLTKNAQNDRERAKILYNWIGSNIKYDNNKAAEVLNGSDTSKMPQSGAIIAFEDRSGICFDKACLYVAMSRAINLKVRLIGGQAYDGEQYVGHAWNQVYLDDENKWINVDSTFYDGGNYFDSNLFDKHNAEEIAGEW